MLILTRRVGETLMIGDEVTVEAAHENAKAFHDKCENKDLRVCGRG